MADPVPASGASMYLGIGRFLCRGPGGCGFGRFVICQGPFMLGPIRLAVLLKERRGIFVDHDSLVMNGGCILMGGNMPLLMTGLLAVAFTHSF